MSKNCFVEYLTEACGTCICWSNGTADSCIGCCAPFPIMECEAFAKIYNEEEQKRERQIISRLEKKIVFYTYVEYTASFPLGSRMKTISGELYLPRTEKHTNFSYEIQTKITRTWKIPKESIAIIFLKAKEQSYKDLEGKLNDYEFCMFNGNKKMVAAENLMEAYYWAGINEMDLDILEWVIIQQHKEVK